MPDIDLERLEGRVKDLERRMHTLEDDHANLPARDRVPDAEVSKPAKDRDPKK